MSHTVQHIKSKSQHHLLLRFLTAIFVPTICLCIALSFGVQEIHKQYMFTQKEIHGTHTINLLFGAFTDLQKIRGLSRIIPWSESSNLANQRQEIIANFNNQFSTAQSQQLSHEFGIEKEVAMILLETQNLYAEKNDTLSEGGKFKRYTSIIEKINSTMLTVADRSNLILDPELDTHYLMEIAVKQIPDLCESFASIRGFGSGMIAQKNTNVEDTKLFQDRISIMQDQLRKFKRTKTIIRQATPDAQLSIRDNESRLDLASSSFLHVCEPILEFNYNQSAQSFFQHGSDVIDVLGDIFHATTDTLETRLNQRVVDFLQLILLTLLLSVGTIAAMFYSSLSFYRLQRESYRKLEQISITDPLTSIPNRRYLDMIFDSEIQRARRDRKGIAFGLMDIDFFKRYNDSYGHHEGDLALQKVAKSLEKSLPRAGDYYFRFGGEEFCFLFTAPTLAETTSIGERIRSAVEQLEIEHCESSVSSYVTVSVGVAFLAHTTNEDLDYMIKQADDLLYQAKDKGRNQCIAKDLG